ncbi:unnamed protein product (mitochondrion) [Plasmodiophora brassicae]|uniref:Uncharacterized protein n=1 Tax=Plasmodiophora brassicae TaxID=37360 RepID=A0A3P3Y0T8_PLABS|nr:unnamed protein product [Plasmodiophora brassicae]
MTTSTGIGSSTSGNGSISIYYEALWVLALFAATAVLREAVGELSCHRIAYRLLSCSFVRARTIDIFMSCSNGGRSLGFGAAWRMWRLDDVIPGSAYLMPMMCWAVGMPIKLIAVTAVRENAIFGQAGAWALGIAWIVLALSVKIVAMFYDRHHGMGLDDRHRLVSYRRIIQSRLCTTAGFAVVFGDDNGVRDPKDVVVNDDGSLGVSVQWAKEGKGSKLTMRAARRDVRGSDPAPNGLEKMSAG